MGYRPSKAEKILGGDLWRLRKVMRALTSILLGLVVVRPWRHALRDRIDQWLIRFNEDKINYFLSHYPEVKSEAETIKTLVDRRCSIARFGDGEFNMCIGRHKSFQKWDERLVNKLHEVLKSNDPAVLIGINTINRKSKLSSIWKKFVIRRGNRVLDLLDSDRVYESSTITTRFPKNAQAIAHRAALLKQIWEGRKAVFVVGRNSRFFFEEELFDNLQEHRFVYGPAKHAFSEYDSIVAEIQTFPKDWLIMISLGPTATVMAYDLACLGYQAIDLGQTPSKYHRAKYGTLYPEGHELG